MIQGLIKANRDGFKNTSKQNGIENVILTVKSDKPTKFNKRPIAFDEAHFKNPAPTPFRTEQIKENTYTAKEFNKLNYSEDPFKELFGYTKRINPDDNINPKFYEYKLGNKNENTFILENLQAENGTATNDVEQREALKDFLELRRLQEAEETTLDTRLGALESIADKQKMRQALKKLRKKERRGVEEVDEVDVEGGLSTGVTTRRARRSKKGGSIAIEPAIKLSKLPEEIDKFKEFEDKTNLKDFKVIDGKVPRGRNVPTKKDIDKVLFDASGYIDGETKDRSGVIKFNKYLKQFGIKPITGKEKNPETIGPKYRELLEKLDTPLKKSMIAHQAKRTKPEKTDMLDRLKNDEDKRAKQQAVTQLEEKIKTKAREHDREDEEAYKVLSARKGRSPRSDIRGFMRATEDEGSLREFEKHMRRGKDLVGLQDEERKLANHAKGARFMNRALQDVKNRKSKESAFDKLRTNAIEEQQKEKSAKFLQQKYRDKLQARKLESEGVDIQKAVNPEDAPAKDTERIRKSLGQPELPESQKVLKDIVATLRPILDNAWKSKQRKVPAMYVPYINSVFKANEELQAIGGKTWRATSQLTRLREALNTIDRKILGLPEPEKRGKGRPRAGGEEAKIGEID